MREVERLHKKLEYIMSEALCLNLESKFVMSKLAALEEQLQELIGSIDNEKVLEINAISVEKVATANVQCLFYYIKQFKQKGLEVKWSSVSFDLCDAIELLGMSDDLGV